MRIVTLQKTKQQPFVITWHVLRNFVSSPLKLALMNLLRKDMISGMYS